MTWSGIEVKKWPNSDFGVKKVMYTINYREKYALIKLLSKMDWNDHGVNESTG